jgi:ABC-type glycerol-3-phosphate transport system substrate-binding protein
MQKNKPPISLRFFIATSLFLFASFSIGLAQPVTITWLVDSFLVNLLKPSVEKFEQANPNIKVVLQGLPFEQVFAQTQVRLAAKSTDLDVVSVDAPLVTSYGLQGFLAPLTKVFSKAEIASFLPASIETGIYKKILLAPPLSNSSQVLYYNKDLLTKAGVPLPSESPFNRLTWEQVAEAAQKTLSKENGRVTTWGLTIDQVDRPYQLLPLPLSLGGQSIGKDGLSVTGVINSPSWIKAFTFYQDLFNKWGVTPKSANVSGSDLFAAGQTAFFWGATWYIGAFQANKDLKWGFAPTPYFAGGKPVTPNDSWHIGINRYSKNFDAAAKLVKFMALGEGNDMFANPLFGSPPTRKSVANSVATDPRFAEFPNTLMRLVSYEVANTAVPRPLTPGFNEYQSVLTAAFGDIRTGSDPKQVLDQAAIQIDRSMAKYRR